MGIRTDLLVTEEIAESSDLRATPFEFERAKRVEAALSILEGKWKIVVLNRLQILHVDTTFLIHNSFHPSSLSQLSADGGITWNHVAVSLNLAGEFPSEPQPNRYYSARETASSPLLVQTSAGQQQEKFLFYRGVSANALPLSANLTSDGKLVVKSLSGDEMATTSARSACIFWRLRAALLR